MDKITAGKKIQAIWVNPINGERTPIGEFENTGIQSFKTPDDWDDAVLLLKSI
jgi:hypothetical protein